MRLECKVTIASPDKIQEFTAVYDQTIYQFLVNGHFKVDAVHAPCGGRNLCGKCLIKTSGKISPMSNNERRLLGDKAQEGWRLACMTRIHLVFGQACIRGFLILKRIAESSFSHGRPI